MMQRTLVIGDIHGCYDELLRLIETAKIRSNDQIIAVGDLITKGPKNREVLDFFATGDNRSSVIGNHDFAILRFWRGEEVDLTEAQERTLSELQDNPRYYRDYLESLPFYIELEAHVVVHAGLRPGVPLSEQTKEDLMELRTLGPDRTSREGIPWFEKYDGDKVVLFGHWPGPEPKLARRAIGLDTGCVYGNRLTGYIIESSELISVPLSRIETPP